jgi:hypothetical protein
MKIKMLTLLAGPGGVRQPNTVHDVPPAEAEALIVGGYAEKVEPAKAAPVAAEGKPRAATRSRGRTGTKPEAEEVEETASAEDGEEEDPTE